MSARAARTPLALAVFAGATVGMAGFGDVSPAAAGPLVQDTGAQTGGMGGEAIYLDRCAFCHGEQGDGNGPVADYLLPRPRDFTGAVFKLTTSTAETLASDDDLVRIIKEGLPGTAMPAWGDVLSDAEIASVIAHLKTFDARDWEDEALKAEAFAVGSPPSVDAGLVARGREVFLSEEANCVSCHGQEGHGDGASATNPDERMVDDWGQPIYPRDLHKAWAFRGGRDLEDIYTRISLGLPGSPMPNHLDALPEDADRWALAAYVQSLGEALADGDTVIARRAAGALPAEPDDAAWDAAPKMILPLSGQTVFPPRWQNHSVDAVGVQALYDDQAIAFRLTWGDRTNDTEDSGHPPELPAGTKTYVAKVAAYHVDHPAYSDKIELQFPAKLEEGIARPYFLYGTASKPVALWRWDAAGDGARELVQAGFAAAAEAQARAGQQVAASGSWKDGEYRLVLTRPRQPADAGDIAFPVGVPVPFALHAWDGWNGETSWVDEDGEARHLNSVSAWYAVVLEPETPPTVYLWSIVAAALVAGGQWGLGRWLRRGGPGDDDA